MARKNKHVDRAKLSQREFIRLVRFFAAGMEASRIAEELGVSRNTVNAYMRRIRERIAVEAARKVQARDAESAGAFIVIRTAANGARTRKTGRAFLHGRIFGDRRISIEVQNGREGEVLHTLLGGYLQIEGQVYTESRSVFTDFLDGELPPKHIRCDTDGARQAVAMLESSLETTRTRLEQFRGVKRGLVRLHIKESEFRFNSGQNVEKALLKMLRERPLL
ncbi:MAG: LuxR C-terminal-related transcriptional regulator [Oceanidesulfovibrio sp.]